VEPVEAPFLPWHSDILSRALALKQQQHLPHAVLIDTASEQDISDFAGYLASLLLCDKPDELLVCGSCQACRMMRAGTYADFTMVALEENEKTKKINKNINIEQIRKLIHEVTLTRNYDRLKIAVIYPAEGMNKSSANALLKTLEEPAPQVLLILLTHNRGRIPITLRSRCQSWTLNLPSQSQALEWLHRQGVEDESALDYLRFADGDPVLALQLKIQDYASIVAKFKTGFARFLRGELSVTELCRGLASAETSTIRRLVNMTLMAYCYQTSGVDANANPVPGTDRQRAQALTELRLKAQRQLQVEENNLDLQLQLEDVLISLKQILTRRLI
jgi:DNA polymerase-3 subunit delta'